MGTPSEGLGPFPAPEDVPKVLRRSAGAGAGAQGFSAPTEGYYGEEVKQSAKAIYLCPGHLSAAHKEAKLHPWVPCAGVELCEEPALSGWGMGLSLLVPPPPPHAHTTNPSERNYSFLGNGTVGGGARVGAVQPPCHAHPCSTPGNPRDKRRARLPARFDDF